MRDIQHPDQEHRYITTISKEMIGDPQDCGFRPQQVNLKDITTSLSKACRYNGHIEGFYSVAEHSVLVSRIAEELGDSEAIIPSLFHDAHEAYMGDIASPQKDMILGARSFEMAMEQIVRQGLCLPSNWDAVWRRVRNYDTMILHRELRALHVVPPGWFNPEIERSVPESVQPRALEWQPARRLLIERIAEVNFNIPETV